MSTYTRRPCTACSIATVIIPQPSRCDFDRHKWVQIVKKFSSLGFTNWETLPLDEVMAGSNAPFFILLTFVCNHICPHFTSWLLQHREAFIVETTWAAFLRQLYPLLKQEFEYVPAINQLQCQRNNAFANAKMSIVLDVLVLFRRREIMFSSVTHPPERQPRASPPARGRMLSDLAQAQPTGLNRSSLLVTSTCTPNDSAVFPDATTRFRGRKFDVDAQTEIQEELKWASVWARHRELNARGAACRVGNDTQPTSPAL